MIKCPGTGAIVVGKVRHSPCVLFQGAILRVHACVMCEHVHVYGCVSWCVLVCVLAHVCMYVGRHIPMHVCVGKGREVVKQFAYDLG